MEVGKTLYVQNRKQWRSWLTKHHGTADEIWLVYYKKNSGKTRIPYNDAVEEALCFGWIDSILKPGNEDYYYQRFSPRRKNSVLSELNKARVRQLLKVGKMTKYGLESIQHHFEKQSKRSQALNSNLKEFQLPDDIVKELQTDPVVWKHFQKFSKRYQHIRIGWIDSVRNHPTVFRQRLNYFIKMTAKNKKFGMVQ
jgi:uncharacterized protein YdeI (YjbR/CyaY-like superfamily)